MKPKAAESKTTQKNDQKNGLEIGQEREKNDQTDERTDKNRNITTAEPLNRKELNENLSGADSGLEKPKNQEG